MRGIAAAILLALVMAAPIGMVQPGAGMPVHNAQPILAASPSAQNVITQISKNSTADILQIGTAGTSWFVSSPTTSGGIYYNSAYTVSALTFSSWNGTIDMRVGGER